MVSHGERWQKVTDVYQVQERAHGCFCSCFWNLDLNVHRCFPSNVPVEPHRVVQRAPYDGNHEPPQRDVYSLHLQHLSICKKSMIIM
ncbi:hypothetical protein ATCV1_z828R [Acanthocystis turfacea chlorella virus 1]|uniref:Uncharacterized protein z828R n=1 Tax=Chlorovirus heliozoae TaxID=322019 RepID=A7KA88_9PHYC|nr:hypothetical protein ATCV1_z828R [Acanthocystis turfacea chlorella virus 1]ABT16962.1 hypothetical protein ATCV1_z828R [Acanthocystis turfacea chlorella virus 1]